VRDNLLEFYRDEISQRNSYNYPPFKMLIKISLDGKKPYLVTELEKIQQLFSEYYFTIFPAFIKNNLGSHTAFMLIKADYHNWPQADLVSKILSLPPSFSVKVDPDSIV
jgi:primosomal protein N'